MTWELTRKLKRGKMKIFMVNAPWTDEQVETLQKWQEDDTKHPYTCVCGESLTPYNSGLCCEYCGHTQDWCWNFSVEDDLQKRLDKLEEKLNKWKADAERLASLVEEQLNAYDIMALDGVKSITEEGYKKLECAFNAHTVLVEKDKEGKWNELAKHVLDENRGAWEELGKEDK